MEKWREVEELNDFLMYFEKTWIQKETRKGWYIGYATEIQCNLDSLRKTQDSIKSDDNYLQDITEVELLSKPYQVI